MLFAARQAKQRPLTDPLIVHVPDTASALAVVDFEVPGGGGEKARRLLNLLGEKLWPGEVVTIAAGRAEHGATRVNIFRGTAAAPPCQSCVYSEEPTYSDDIVLVFVEGIPQRIKSPPSCSSRVRPCNMLFVPCASYRFSAITKP